MAQDATRLVWIDMEMTGLDPDSDRILEVATVITTSHLDIVAEGPFLPRFGNGVDVGVEGNDVLTGDRGRGAG